MPALVVIRSSSKQIDYQENRSVWRRARGPDDRGQSDSDNGDDSADGDHDRDIEEANGQPPPPSRLGAGYGLSTELRDMEGLNAFRCADCGAVVADRDDVVSKTFFGRTGKAFLMNNMYNVRAGPARNRYLMTGMHTIADVACAQCDAVLGWKYVKAMETSQKYKEGKFIMEHAVVQDDWEERAWDRLE